MNTHTKVVTTDGESRVDIARVSVMIPPLWRKNVRTWLIYLDGQFTMLGITAEEMKYHHVVAALEPDIADAIGDFFTRPISATPYSDLKTRLLREFEESEASKIRNFFLEELELGDQKPSDLLREMKSLTGNISDRYLRPLFLNKLPDSARSILAASNDDLNSLALMADKILDLLHQPIRPVPSQSTATLEQQIRDLTEQVQHLQALYHELSNCRHFSRRRSRSRSSSRRKCHSTWCWFHNQFGVAAKKCTQPCSF